MPPANAETGTSVDIPVKVTYPEETAEETPVKATVASNRPQENIPGYNGGSTKPGVGVNIPQTGDTQLPPNTRFEIPQGGVPSGWTVTVNPNNGEVTVTPPADAEPGTSVDIPIKVTYPDGSTEETPVKVTVTPNQAQENTPGYEDGNTTPGNPVTVPQTGDTELPPGTKFEVPPTSVPEGWEIEVNPDNGEVTVTPPADAEPGTSVDIPIKVTYGDGDVLLCVVC
ncbi:YPDG domain-containing protein [Staphylococcus felis]|uniref:YPDG domain-containing protein n=1 Tax=Staphylococcus felis TaxID=46127 RepID=UPI003452CDC2